MKFFSDLGSCYRPSPGEAANGKRSAPETAESCSNHRVVRGGRSRAGHWQPNLSVISEDYVVLLEDEERKTRLSSHHAQQKKRSVAAKSRGFSHGQDHQRGNYTQIVVPMFSPTPFVF